LTTKMNAQFAAGDSGFLVWSWNLNSLGACSYDTGPSDGALSGLLGSLPTNGASTG